MNASWAIFILCLISRYVEANLRRSNEYHRYYLLLLEYLHNRPYRFTKHFAKKVELAKAIGENRVTNINDNDFTVTSLQKIGTKEYKVTKERKAVLTNNNRFLSCECADCKHMFAIFKNIGSLLCAYYFLGSASKTDHHFCKLVLGPHFHKLEYG